MKRDPESGQALVEYILLLAIIVGIYMLVVKGFSEYQIAKKLTARITGPFTRTYRYGHPQTRGYEDGTPKKHPRVPVGEDNFRIFINPGTTK